MEKKSLQIQVVSEEIIKPSSPTPENLRNYPFSLFDQNSGTTYMPIIYLYVSDGDDDPANIRKLSHLKKSLSEALNLYYPLAGRLTGEQSFECNDEGVMFVEAKANCAIDDVVTTRNSGDFNKLVPFEAETYEPRGGAFILAVQFTHFECGGVSVAALMSHKIADGISLFCFINSWAAVTRGDGENNRHLPIFEAAQIFPAMEIPKSQPQRTKVTAQKEEIVGRIFKFPSSKISYLQQTLFNSGGEGRRPSRVEAITAFIWTRYYSATVTDPDPAAIYPILNVMNLRTRFDPPLSDYLFGNITGFSISVPATENGKVIDGTDEIVRKIQESNKSMNGPAHVDQIRNKNKILDAANEKAGSTKKCDIVPFIFTSLSRFPWHEANFGWGKPARVGLARSIEKNIVSLIDSTDGDGIEACVNMSKEDMEKFQNDPDVKKLLDLQ